MDSRTETVTRLILVGSVTKDHHLRRRMAKTASRLIVSDMGTALDAGQMGLDVAGLVPGVGEVFDGVNALVSLIRGDYLGAALSVISMVPLAGDALGKGGKLAVWLGKLAKKEGKLGKAGKLLLKNGPKFKTMLAKFTQNIMKHRKEILASLVLVRTLVKVSLDPSKKSPNAPKGLNEAAEMVNRNPKLKGIVEKAAPSLDKLNGSVMNILTLAHASEKMFAQLEARAKAETQQPQAVWKPQFQLDPGGPTLLEVPTTALVAALGYDAFGNQKNVDALEEKRAAL